MNSQQLKGIWVTMVTPFYEDLEINYDIIDRQVDWYIRRGVNGIFTVCQSSEMDFLTRAERQKLSRRVVEAANGRIPVIASGHLSDTVEGQLLDVESIWETGVDSVVLVSNRFAGMNDGEEVFLKNLDHFLNCINPKIPLGMYECPSPYKWLLTEKAMQYCINSGRIKFFKDTSCDPKRIKSRVQAAQNSQLKLFNANAATFLQSLRDGADGYSGVMANFHPELYRWLYENYNADPRRAERLSAFLSVASICECRNYPDCAKYYMGKSIPGMELYSRKFRQKEIPESIRMEISSMEMLAEEFRKECGIHL